MPNLKLDSLTSLRFFAAFWIVLYHSRDQFNCLWDLPREIVFSQGVTFFFVLSGFILAFVYPHLSTKKEIKSYLLKRFGRIWPLHAAVLILVVATLPQSVQLVQCSSPAPYPLIFAANLCMVHAWVPIDQFFFSFNPPSWSISNEIFFYLALPLILFFSCDKNLKKLAIPLSISFLIILFLCLFANSMHLPMADPNSLSLQALVGVNPLVRIFDFILGVIFGTYFAQNKDQLQNSVSRLNATICELISLALILLMVCNTSSIAENLKHFWLTGEAGSYWLREAGLVVLPFALLIFSLALQKGFLSKILSAPPLVLLGEISFALYLCHFPLIKYSYSYFPEQRSLISFVLFLAILFSISYLSFRLLESPARNYFARLADSKAAEPFSASRLKKHIIPVSIASALLMFSFTLYFSGDEHIEKYPVTEQLRLLSRTSEERAKTSEIRDGLKLIEQNLRGSYDGDKVILLTWESTKDQTIDYSVLIQLSDGTGHLIHQQQLPVACHTPSRIKDKVWRQDIYLPRRACEEAHLITVTVEGSNTPIVIQKR